MPHRPRAAFELRLSLLRPDRGRLLWLLSLAVVLFIAANLAVGFTFSTMAENQLQAMQMTFFFFLPSMLLSGFMFPFRGMPGWAQAIGEVLPLATTVLKAAKRWRKVVTPMGLEPMFSA